MSIARFPPPRVPARRAFVRAGAAGIALAVFALCAFSPAVLNDGDTWTHVATGDWIFAHRAIPRVDPFSYRSPASRGPRTSGCRRSLLALAYRAAGLSGVVLLTGLAAGDGAFRRCAARRARLAGRLWSAWSGWR